jgi:TPR repeat protein
VRPAVALSLVLAACAADSPAGTAASASAPAAASAAAALPPSSADARPPAFARTVKLQRTALPADRLAADQRACEGGDKAACRKVASRFRGYGHAAGCGVDRKRDRPSSKVLVTDAVSDARAFARWMKRACDLGDEDACLIAGAAPNGFGLTPDEAADACLRSAPSECALYGWQSEAQPGYDKILEQKRTERIKNKEAFWWNERMALYKKTEPRPTGPLPDTIRNRAARLCKATLDCDSIMMMLDKDGFTPEALAPLRKDMGEALAAACVEGACTCGQAARYVDAADARLADLAQLGCENGEADGCFVLGTLFEEGRGGVEKDFARAFSLYEVACPRVLPRTGFPGPRAWEISKLACDRLAAIYEEGRGGEAKDMERAIFYAKAACLRAGFERHHAPCLRLGRYYGKGNGDLAREMFFGIVGLPVLRKECERPSVKAQCDAERHLIPAAPR